MQKTKLSASYEPWMPTKIMIHLDEAGRGPLAGPITVWATIALEKFDRSRYKDSKILSEKKREELYSHIEGLQKTWTIVAATSSASNIHIDEKWIIRAQYEASVRAIFLCLRNYFVIHWWPALQNSVFGEDQIAFTILSKLFNKRKLFDIYTASGHTGKNLWLEHENIITYIANVENTICTLKSIIYDGNHTYGLENSGIQVITIVKWDSKNPLISIASIIAKVDRDRYMSRLSHKYTWYQLEQHKGYGTVKHRLAIRELGISDIHRKTFCKNIVTHQETKCSENERKRIIKNTWSIWKNRYVFIDSYIKPKQKPALLLHICS